MKAVLEAVYETGAKNLPETSPGDYVEKKRAELTGGTDLSHLVADFIGEMGLHLVVYAGRLLERRRSEGGVERRRVQGATVARGKMLDVGKYERPEPEYEELPQDHPARRQESYIVSSAKGPSRR